MSTLPTSEERKELERRTRAKHKHFVLLVILIASASLTFLFPDVSPIVILLVGLGICLVGASAFRLQHLQGCPRCSSRLPRGSASCAGCGLEFYAVDQHKQEHS